MSEPTKFILNLQDFLLHFKTKKYFSIFLLINYPDVTISMRKKFVSLQVKNNNKLHHIISIDNDCDVHHCKSDCNLYKSMPTNVSM